jgi:endonuclease YncB( thermonuclease family)
MKSPAVIALSFSLVASLALSCVTPPSPGAPAETIEPAPSPQPPSPTAPATESPAAEEASPTAPKTERVEASVVEVIDGDTIDVRIGGQVYTVRYLGLDCPEADSHMGMVAADINRALVEGKTVELERDASEVDQYDRLLRYVYVGGVLVNAELIRLGYAHAVTLAPDLAHADEFLQLEQEARLEGRGIWSLEESPTPVAPTPVPPTPTTEQPTNTPEPPTPTPTTAPAAPAQVVVNPGCCQFDSPGNDNYSKEEEYACLTNNGGQAADMTGWYLRDDYG